LEGPDGFLKKCCDLTNGEMDDKKHGSIKGGQKKTGCDHPFTNFFFQKECPPKF